MKTVNSDYRSIFQLRNLLDNKTISAVELTQDTLSNIDKTNSIINSFVLVTAGVTTAGGTLAYQNRVPKKKRKSRGITVSSRYDHDRQN